MKKRQITYALPALMLATSLVGCMVENDKTGGSPPADTKVTIVVGNTSNQSYARAVLKDNSGNTIFDKDINCRANQTDCMIFQSSEVKQPSTLIVEDSNRRMIGAFQYPDALLSYNSAYPTPLSTGLYLAKQLLKKNLQKDGIDWDDANSRLANFFKNYDSPDGSVDFYEELGDYYAKQIATSGITEKEFLETLKKRLENWDVAKPEELPKLQQRAALSVGKKSATASDAPLSGKEGLTRPAQAQSIEGCAAGVETFLTIAGGVGSSFPIVGDVVGAVFGVAKDSCDTTGAKLDKITSQLVTLQESVDNIGGEVGQIKSLQAMSEINTATAEFQKFYRDASKTLADYKTFLTVKGVSSLEEYFKKEGGWKQGRDNGGALLQKNVLGEMSVLIKGSKEFELATFNTYLHALKNKCEAMSWAQPDTNFVAARQFCNTNIVTNTAMFVGTESALMPMFKDIFATLSKYNNEAVLDYPYPLTDITSYSQATQKVGDKFKAQQQKLVDRFKANVPTEKQAGSSGLYNAYADLSPTLQQSLVTAGCSQFGRHGRSNYPAITGWFAKTTQAKDRYITTQCPISGPGGMRVNAKYDYESQGLDPVVVLGVPVAKRFINEDIGTASGDYVSIYTNHQYQLSNAIFEAPTVSFISTAQNAPAGFIRVADEPGANRLHPISGQPGKYYAERSQAKSSSTTWILVSHSNKDLKGQGFADVVKLRLKTGDSGNSSYNWGGHLVCVTPSCSVEQKQWLKFENGSTLDARVLTRKTADNKPIVAIGPVESMQ